MFESIWLVRGDFLKNLEADSSKGFSNSICNREFRSGTSLAINIDLLIQLTWSYIDQSKG